MYATLAALGLGNVRFDASDLMPANDAAVRAPTDFEIGFVAAGIAWGDVGHAVWVGAFSGIGGGIGGALGTSFGPIGSVAGAGIGAGVGAGIGELTFQAIFG